MATEPDLIERLEAAAGIVLSPPDKVQPGERRSAEAFFMQLRNSTKVPLDLCRRVLEGTSNDFVVFQAVCAVREATLREWVLLGPDEIQAVWKYLLNYAAQHANSPNFVMAELLQAVAMILKRGSLDDKSGESTEFYSTVNQWIGSQDIQLQALACQALLSLCNEFASSWRSSDVGITWDFHIRAKRHFEANDLKRILQLAVEVLNSIVAASSDAVSERQQVVLANRFICVTETIFQWHFGTSNLPKRLTYAIEFGASAALRPPASWADVFLNENLVNFFFVLHSRIRHNAEISHHSMQCIIQLASLMGEIFGKKNAPNPDVEPRDAYVTNLVKNIVELFSGGTHEHEMLPLCTAMSKLFTYHPLPCLLRMPGHQFDALLSFVVALLQDLFPKTVHEIMNESDGRHAYESCVCLLDTWHVIIKAQGRLIRVPAETMQAAGSQLMDACCSALMAPPNGTRPPLGKQDEETDEEAADIVLDDRDEYADLLNGIGHLSRSCYAHSLHCCTQMLTEKLVVLSHMVSTAASIAGAEQAIHSWQEDMHWLLLLCGSVLTHQEADGSCQLRPEALSCSAQTAAADPQAVLLASQAYMRACLSDPEQTMAALAADANAFGNICPVVRLLGRVWLWAAVEYRLLSEGRTALLSPQLAQTTFWLLRRVCMAFIIVPAESARDDSSTVQSAENEFPPALKCSEVGGELAQYLIDFCLTRAFAAFSQWSGEKRVANDAVGLLVGLLDNGDRAERVSSSPNLLSCISRIDIQCIASSSKRQLMRVLVLIGAASNDQQLRQTMYNQILDPLAARTQSLMHSVSARSQGAVDNELLNVLDCLAGVADAVQLFSAAVLFEYLIPQLELCPPLLAAFAHNQALVDCVLSLFQQVSRRLAVFLDNQVDCQRLYSCLMQLIGTYAQNQLTKYRNATEIEEEKASDLQLMMSILGNILSRDILVLTMVNDDCSDQLQTAASVALAGLEMIMPLMNAELLQLPTLCAKFYTLLLYMAEMYPDNLLHLRPDVIETFLKCAHAGLNLQFGKDIMRTSLELIGLLATYLCQLQEPSEQTLQLKTNLGHLIKPVFRTALESSCELEVFGEATLALYALICCNKAMYSSLVAEVVTAHASGNGAHHANNELAAHKLHAAFVQLLSPDTDVVCNAIRQEKRQFRERFDVFLNDISGLLSLRLIDAQ